MATETGWAIAGRYGLYVGWWMSRNAAIRDHVVDLLNVGQKSGRPTPAQMQGWKKLRKNGDRAVKVRITYG